MTSCLCPSCRLSSLRISIRLKRLGALPGKTVSSFKHPERSLACLMFVLRLPSKCATKRNISISMIMSSRNQFSAFERRFACSLRMIIKPKSAKSRATRERARMLIKRAEIGIQSHCVSNEEARRR